MLNACPTAIDFDVYQPRKPKASAYYRCVEDHFEQLEAVWLPARRQSLQLGEDERYQGRFGFWRPYVTDVIRRYLASGSESLTEPTPRRAPQRVQCVLRQAHMAAQ